MLKILITCLLPFTCFSQTVPYRHYKKGEVLKYRISTESYRNGQPSGKSVAVSKHRVIKHKGVWSEEIRWLGKTNYSGDSVTAILDSITARIKPYRVSLSPKGNVPLPKLDFPAMTGEITDLNTFLVAIAPALKAQQLSATQTQLKNEGLRQGNFADGVLILTGTDCIEVTQQLLKDEKDYAEVRTSFLPPATFCLEPLIDSIRTVTGTVPNNFQMIQKGAGDKVNLFWGVESFIIDSKIDKRTGRLLEAEMTNELALRMRYNSTKDLTTYAVEMPVSIKRKVKLELMKE